MRVSSRFSHGQGAAPVVLSAKCGESRSPVLSPASKEPRRETGLQLSIIFAETMPHENDSHSRLDEQSMGGSLESMAGGAISK